MSILFELNVSGDEEMRKLLDKAANLDTTDMMEALSVGLVAQTESRFDSKTAPDGTPWAPWSERYAKTRRGNHSLLIDSSRMITSIYGSHTRTTASVGSPVPYAAAHQKGNPNKNLPARPFLGTSPENLEELHDIGADYLRVLFGVG